MKKRSNLSTRLIFIVMFSFMGLLYFNYYLLVKRPMQKAATTFLEALKTRDDKLLQQVVVPEEYETYKALYLRMGFGKHLISYGEISRRSIDGVFFPKNVRYDVKVEETDPFFDRRTIDYRVILGKYGAKWKVVQFSSMKDYEDLKVLERFKMLTQDKKVE